MTATSSGTARSRVPLAAIAIFALASAVALLGSAPLAASVKVHNGRDPSGMRLEVPTGLALAPDGDLFIADQWLNQIVERLPDGRFRVVAGTGKGGFGGDGGPARRAALDSPTALVRAPDGTLYFVDEGNHRVRAILSNGNIVTVAGGGPLSGAATIASGTPTTEVSFSPSDLAVGPDGEVYVTDDDQVLEFLPSGVFTAVAGPSNVVVDSDGVGSCGPDAVAFDGAGDMWIGCDNSRQLLERMPDGTSVVMADLYRPHDFPGLGAAPGGSMVAADGESLSRFARATNLLDLADFPHSDTFVPSGVAVASNGTIYTDSRYGDGFTTAAALAEIRPDGAIVVLDSWKGKS